MFPDPEPQIIFEVILLAFVNYGFIRHLQSTRGGGLLAGFMVLLILSVTVFAVVVRKFQLPHLGWIADAALPALAFALLIIFQPELRLAISRIGDIKIVQIVQRLFGAEAPVQRTRVVEAIVGACERMSQSRTGALIAIQGRHAIEGFGSTGVRIGGEVTARLLETIFYKGTPLHDGAVLIIGGRVMYAACHLPSASAESPELTRDLGTRHRAALGMSEDSDALVIAVSEETGRISIARKGKLRVGVSSDRLRSELEHGMSRHSEASKAEAAATLAKAQAAEELADLSQDQPVSDVEPAVRSEEPVEVPK